MLNEGFILLHRSMLRWEWYGDGNTARLFIHLLLTVNYRPQHWRGLKIRRGQRVASVAKLAEELNMTPKCVRLALQRNCVRTAHALHRVHRVQLRALPGLVGQGGRGPANGGARPFSGHAAGRAGQTEGKQRATMEQRTTTLLPAAAKRGGV